MPNYKENLELMKSHYDVHLRSANYLFVAHGAGLVGCLSTLKDYTASGPLKGIGTIILLFGIGFIGGIINYISLVFARAIALNAAHENTVANKSAAKLLESVHYIGLLTSLFALITAILVLIYRFISL